jgi:hypothetical protein
MVIGLVMVKKGKIRGNLHINNGKTVYIETQIGNLKTIEHCPFIVDFAINIVIFHS